MSGGEERENKGRGVEIKGERKKREEFNCSNRFGYY